MTLKLDDNMKWIKTIFREFIDIDLKGKRSIRILNKEESKMLNWRMNHKIISKIMSFLYFHISRNQWDIHYVCWGIMISRFHIHFHLYSEIPKFRLRSMEVVLFGRSWWIPNLTYHEA